MTDRHDTTRATIVRTDPEPRTGYRRLTVGPAEQHRDRTELITAASAPALPEQPLARLIQVTDFQLADLASPSRLEFLQRLDGVPAWRRMLPAYRPQEFLLLQAIEALLRTVRGTTSADRPVDAVITTGDNTDSAQYNELITFLTLMNGGTVRPGDPEAALAATPTASGDTAYWNPEPASRDSWKTDRGLPDHPGALAAAGTPFEAVGLGLPWLACFGNHDCLVQGRAPAPAGYDDFLTGSTKPVQRPPEADPPDPDSTTRPDTLDAYCADPMIFSTGPAVGIEAWQDRRMVDRRSYVALHRATGRRPAGHGFTAANVADGTAYYSYDGIPGLRVITLDTTNPAGGVDGCLDERQFGWLAGTLATAGDRLVIICSHHGLSTLTNATGDGTWGGRLHLADEVEALLHRHPAVILWLSGHTHVNKVTPRPTGAGGPDSGGFWEVSTSSVAEWPVQARELEIFRSEQGIAIRTTMIDSAVPAVPTGDLDLDDLAALHREVAANDPGSVGGLDAQGTTADRNVVLHLPPLPAVDPADRPRP